MVTECENCGLSNGYHSSDCWHKQVHKWMDKYREKDNELVIAQHKLYEGMSIALKLIVAQNNEIAILKEGKQ